jgi:hypothetical protein
MQEEAGTFGAAMQILQVLVQLSHLRAQGAFDQHADLPPLCHQPAMSE